MLNEMMIFLSIIGFVAIIGIMVIILIMGKGDDND